MNLLHRLASTRTQAHLHSLGVVVVALMLMLMMAVAVPAWTRRTRHTELRAAIDAAAATLQRTRGAVDQSLRDSIALQAKLNAAATDAAETRTLDRRLLDVSSVAGELGLIIDSVEPGAVSKRSEADTVTAIAANGRGSYPHVVAFIHRLREIAPDLTVDSVQLAATAERSCSFRLALSWWSAPQSAARPTALAGGGER